MTAETDPPAAPQIGLLDMVQAGADDVPGAVAFYRDVLGAVAQQESEAWGQVRLGGVTLGIHRRPAAAEGWMPVFRVTDVAAVKRAVERSGRAVLQDYHDVPGGVVLTFADPAGNPVQVLEIGASEAELRERA